MNDDTPLLPETLEALSRAFVPETPDAAVTPTEQVTMEEVQLFLIEKITILLDRNPAMLMSILYRIDVAEREVKRVLTEDSPPEIPSALASLVIERQLQKVRIRRRYRAYDPGAADKSDL